MSENKVEEFPSDNGKESHLKVLRTNVEDAVRNGLSSYQADRGVLQEQITLLRDLLAGKNNWLQEQIVVEQQRSAKLQIENDALRTQAQQLKVALAQACAYAESENYPDTTNWEKLAGLR